MATGRARLTQADFQSMVSDLAGQQSERLGLDWINQGDGRWENELQSEFGPKLVHNGAEAVFSTCQDVQRWPSVVWDVNGYYAALGVPWWAHITEIRDAYRDLVGIQQDNGHAVRLTYIFKVMLDPERRAKYDATPMGSMFNDPFVAEAVRLADAWETSQRLLRGDITFDEAVEMQAALDAEEAALDDEALANSLTDGTDRSKMIGGGQWRWSYYVLDTSCDDHQRLSRWQALLVRYLSRKRKGVRVAVGFVGATAAPFEVHAVGFRTVVLLNDGNKPTRRLAKQAASAVVKHIKSNG